MVPPLHPKGPLEEALAGLGGAVGTPSPEAPRDPPSSPSPGAAPAPLDEVSLTTPEGGSPPDEAWYACMRAAAAARRRSDARNGVVRENLAEIQAEAAARSRAALPPAVTPVSAARALPPEARAAAGLPMKNPPVHRKQIKPIPGKINTEGFLARVRTLPAAPLLSNKTMTAVARAIVWFIGKAASPDQAVRGVAQASYASIATAAQCSRTQVWRSIKTFLARGILDIFNVPVRDGNEFYRDPNAYVLRGFTEAVPAVIEAVKDVVTGAFDRLAEQVRRFEHVWDMRANHPRSRTHPAPA